MGTRFLNALALTATTLGAVLGATLATPAALAAQRADRPARPVTVPATRPQAVAAGARTAPAAGALAEAAQKGDLAAVRQLLARGGDANAAQGDGMTALHWAAERGDSAMLGALLSAKADAGARTRIGNYTPLHLAARTGSAGAVRTLLAGGAEVDAATLGGATPLHLAATGGNADVVRALLEKGAQANAREAVWGQTPLVFAAERDRDDAISALIAGGADPSIRTDVMDLMEQEARQQAAQKKRNAVLIAFEPKARRDSADADHKRAVDAAKAQLAAAQAQQRPAAPAAPAAPAKPGAAPDRGDSASTAAAAVAARDPGTLVNAQGAQAALGFLARLPVREPRGPFTPAQIQIAIDSGRAVMLAKVLPKDSVREQVDTANGGVAGYTKQVGSVGGLTALHHAARQGSVAAARALIDGGAKLNDTSSVDRMTPLMMAAVNGQFDVAKLLAERGADPNIVTTYGMSPLYAILNAQWAPRSRYPQPQAIQTQQTSYMELAAVLLAKGAKPDERVTKQPWWFAYNNCGSFNCGLEVIDGTTPFWRAAYALDVDAMRLLKKHGASDTIPSTPPKPTARGGGAAAAAGAARPDSGAARRADTTLAKRDGATMQKEVPAHTSAGANAPSMTPTTLPSPTAPVAVAVTDTAKPVTAADSAVRRAASTPRVARNEAKAASAPAAAASQGGGQGGGQGAAPGPKLDPEIVKLARVAPVGPGVLPIHAVAGVGYGNGFAGNAHRYAPDAWMPALRYLVEELKADVNARDNNGFTPLHHAAARGDNEMIRYLVSKGADVKAVSRTGRTVVDMANGPVQRLRPFPETIELLEKLGAKNQNLCVSC